MPTQSGIARRLQSRLWIITFLQTGRLPTGNPFTGASYLRWIREQGMGYRTQDVYADIRYTREVLQRTGQYGDLDPSEFIPPNKIINAATHRKERYDYVVKGHFIDEADGTDQFRHFTIRSDKALTKGSVLDTAEDRFSNSHIYDLTEFTEWELDQVIEYRGIRSSGE